MAYKRAVLYFDSSKVCGEGNSVIFQVQRTSIFVSRFFIDNEGFQWNLKKYSIGNDYVWNTAVYFDLFYFWIFKSTMGGKGALRCKR